MKNYLHYFCLALALLNITCARSRALKINEVDEEVLFSGLWKNVTGLLSKDMRVVAVKNCEVKLSEGQRKLRPLSIGTCSVLVETKNNYTRYTWSVIQLPDPSVHLGPFAHKGLIIRWDDPSIYFINPTISDTSNYFYFKSPGKLYTYDEKVVYTVEGFSMKIFNNRDSLVYSNMEYWNRFSCEDFEAFRNFTREKGTKVIIDSVNVYFPDQTMKIVAMDTLKY